MGQVYDLKVCGLRPFSPRLLEEGSSTRQMYERWMSDGVVTRYNSHGLFPKTHADISAFASAAADGTAGIVWSIHAVPGGNSGPAGAFVGMASLQNINWVNRSAEIALWIGDTRVWGRGIASSVVGALCSHAFLKLGLHRVWSGTAETNLAMNRVFLKCGFTVDGRFREGMYLDGVYVDVVCYSILKKEFIRYE